MTSISMLKICSKSIIKPLLIIYKKCLQKGCFPTSGRKQMLFLFIKKWQTATKKLVYNHPQGKLPLTLRFFFLSIIVITKQCLHDSISKQFLHLHMSGKYGIFKKQVLTILEKQSMVSNGKNNFKIQMLMIWFTFLIELSKIYYTNLFCMKLSHLMTEIHHGLNPR